jgi:hypothetical protein
MSTEPNPYEPPSVVDTPWLGENNSTHQWNSRTVTVSARAAATICWMDHAITVTIDDEIHRERAFHHSDTFRFQFAHDGQWIHGHVKRGWGFFARRMKYELTIDGEIVARSHAPIDNWERGVAVMVAVNMVVFGLLGFELLH